MNINIRKENDFSVIIFNDMSLADEKAKELKEKAVELIEDGEKKIGLDLSSTNFIDSSGVGKLLFLSKKMENIGGELKIVNISEELYSFLDSLAITKVIEITKPK